MVTVICRRFGLMSDVPSLNRSLMTICALEVVERGQLIVGVSENAIRSRVCAASSIAPSSVGVDEPVDRQAVVRSVSAVDEHAPLRPRSGSSPHDSRPCRGPCARSRRLRAPFRGPARRTTNRTCTPARTPCTPQARAGPSRGCPSRRRPRPARSHPTKTHVSRVPAPVVIS